MSNEQTTADRTQPCCASSAVRVAWHVSFPLVAPTRRRRVRRLKTSEVLLQRQTHTHTHTTALKNTHPPCHLLKIAGLREQRGMLRSQTARTHKPHDWSHPEDCLQKGGTRLISQLHEKWKEEFIQQGQRLFYTSNVIFFYLLLCFRISLCNKGQKTMFCTDITRSKTAILTFWTSTAAGEVKAIAPVQL